MAKPNPPLDPDDFSFLRWVGGEISLDAASITVRGYRLDEVAEYVQGCMSGVAEGWKLGERGLSGPGLLQLRDENPVAWRADPGANDAYVSLMGPLSAKLREHCRAIPVALGKRAAINATVYASRLDAAIDLDDGPGTWEKVVGIGEAAYWWGRDWTPYGKESTGRTLYIGPWKGRKRTFMRVYEKGKRSLGDGIPDSPTRVRIEVECHPEGEHREAAMLWTPAEVMSTFRPAMHLLRALGHMLPSFVPSRDSGVRSPLVRKLRAASSQYGASFRALLRRMGDPETAARTLAAVLLQANATPELVQALLDRGVSAPELESIALSALSSKQDAEELLSVER